MRKQLIIAWGIQVRDWSTHNDFVEYLNKKATRAGKGANKWIYKDKKVDYEISFVYTKDEFKAALDTPHAIVVYDGHSRFGQGPAFGEEKMPKCPDKKIYPTNPWGDHFRMGWDAISLPCVEEILDHCTNPVEYSMSKPPSKSLFASKSVKKAIIEARKLRMPGKCNQAQSWRSLHTCYPKIAERENGRDEQSLFKRHYYRADYPRKEEGDFPYEFHTLVEVGAADLAKVNLKCDLLYMNSCSSYSHFYWALKRRKNETKSKCIFYSATELVGKVPSSEVFTKDLLEGLNPWLRKDRDKILSNVNALPPVEGYGAGKIKVDY